MDVALKDTIYKIMSIMYTLKYSHGARISWETMF